MRDIAGTETFSTDDRLDCASNGRQTASSASDEAVPAAGHDSHEQFQKIDGRARSAAPSLFRQNRARGGCDHVRPSSRLDLLLGAPLLAVLILACALCIGTAGWLDSDGADNETFNYDGLTYEIVDETSKTVSVKACLDKTTTTSITIPTTVDHEGQTYTVISIGNSAFKGCTSLDSITIPGTVTSIGKYGISNCKLLTGIQIPDSVTSIGESAFYSSGLTSVTIPSGVTQISDNLFAYCTSLDSVTFKGQVTSIGCNAFNGCKALTEIEIPETVTSIGVYAFSYSGLESIAIPAGVTLIDQYVCAGCSKLTSVTFQGQVASIGYGAFSDCTSLTEFQIPDTVASIDGYAFNGCSSLQSIRFGKEIETIGNKAFSQTFHDETGTIAFDPTEDVGELQGRLFKADKTDKTKMIRQAPHTLTFDCGDGITMKYEYNEGDRIAKPDDPEKTGYSFMYWANDGKEFDFATETMPAEDMTLTAVWKADAFTVTFVTGTGTEIAEAHVYGEAIALPGEGGEISRAGYALSGWQISGQGDVFGPGTEYTVTSDVTFTAVWEAMPSWDDDDDPYYPPSPSGDSGQSGKRSDSSEDILIIVACIAAFMAVLAAYICSTKR